MVHKTLKLAALCPFLSAGAASALTVDFSTNNGIALNEGDVVTSFDFGPGLSGLISSSDLGSNASGDIVVFDSNAGTDSVLNDPDLLSPFTNVDDPNDIGSFGNVLILQETGGSRPVQGAPDDASSGGSITFSFDRPILLEALSILDALDDGPGASLFLDGSATPFDTALGGMDREFDIVNVGQLISSFTVQFEGSGAIGDFSAVAPIPVPATLPMLLSVVGLGYGLRRRQQRNRA